MPTTSRVGSSGIGVRGSSEGWSITPPSSALAKAWFEITVPSGTLGSITTSNVSVATSVPSTPSARIAPGVGSLGAWIGMPAASGAAPPAPSGTGAPLSVVLPAT